MSADRILTGCFGLIAMSLLLLGCSQNNPPEMDQASISKEHVMQLSNKEMAPSQLPPIDAAAPKEFQTASFGLG